jgi:hypothetical protein
MLRSRALASILIVPLLIPTLTACGERHRHKDRGVKPPETNQEPEPPASIEEPAPLPLTRDLAPALVNPSSPPPPFPLNDETVVPVDFAASDVNLVFDVSTKTAWAEATIRFKATSAGLPMLDLQAEVTSLTLDGEELDPALLAEAKLPDGASTVRVLERRLEPDLEHELIIRYVFAPDELKFSDSGASVAFLMSDLASGPADKRIFLEKFAPANLEFDAFAMRLEVEVRGASATHRVFANGAIETLGDYHWRIDFPAYFTSSSCYFHLTEKDLAVVEDDYSGLDAQVPITIYGEDRAQLDEVHPRILEILKELEADYGPFAHARLVVYITEFPGGMEYSGATITSPWALSHELMHSWFARSVMPADGNAGWIDEAIASWRDAGYPSYAAYRSDKAANLAGGSPYRRDTAIGAYREGQDFLSFVDRALEKAAAPRLKSVLRDLFASRRNSTISTPYFEAFLEDRSQLDFSAWFARFVYGKEGSNAAAPSALVRSVTHPRSFTAREVQSLL